MSYGKYARAACDLLEHLSEQDIPHGPVAQPSKRVPRLIVYCMKKSDIKRLPKTFAGFAVEGSTTDPEYRAGKQLSDRVPTDK